MKSVLALLILLVAACAFAGTSIDANHPHAYGANTGWVNMRGNVTTGVVVGLSYCSGHAWGANVGWIGLGDAPPSDGHSYANTSASDYGVNHDGTGRLRGYAWGQNIGWLRFEDTGDPRVSLHSGILSGHAWGANIGWVSLSNLHAYVETDYLDPGPDSDSDGIPDAQEYQHTNLLTVLSGGTNDFDGDGMPDIDECGADTDPLDGDDLLRIIRLERDGTTNVVVWTSRPTRLYYLDSTNVLPEKATNAWIDAGGGLIGPPPGSLSTQTVTGVAAPEHFYRTRAVTPLSPP